MHHTQSLSHFLVYLYSLIRSPQTPISLWILLNYRSENPLNSSDGNTAAVVSLHHCDKNCRLPARWKISLYYPPHCCLALSLQMQYFRKHYFQKHCCWILPYQNPLYRLYYSYFLSYQTYYPQKYCHLFPVYPKPCSADAPVPV